MTKWQKVRLGSIAYINQNIYSLKEGWQFVNYLDTGNITMNKIDEIQHIRRIPQLVGHLRTNRRYPSKAITRKRL